MQVGDLVEYRRGYRWVDRDSREGELCLIIDVVAYDETYASSGCKKYIVLTPFGTELTCRHGDLELCNENR